MPWPVYVSPVCKKNEIVDAGRNKKAKLQKRSENEIPKGRTARVLDF